MIKSYLKIKNIVSVFLGVTISVLLIISIAYGVTTISTNITTDGNLSVSGNATTSGSLVVGTSSWGAPTSTLNLIGSLHVTGISTSSDALWIGSGGTVNNINMLGGDLYAQGDAEIDGGLWVNSATTTDSLAIGGYASSTGNLNTQSNLHVGGAVTIDGITTSTSHIYLPRIKFEQSAATSTNPETGECFMPNDSFKCWDGSAWQDAW